MFTKEELQKLTNKNLVKLAGYYKLKVSKYWNKDKLVNTIYDCISPKIEEEVPPMSVRVRRIREANKEQ